MSRCLVCTRSDRGEIEAQVLAGVGVRELSRQFAVSKSTIHRHSQFCMAAMKAEVAAKAAPKAGTQNRLQRLYVRCEKLLARAERKGDVRTASAIVGQLNDLSARMSVVTTRDTPRENLRIKIVFDDPNDPTGRAKSVDAWENLRYTIGHYGAPRVLEMVLKAMYDGGQFNERIKQACFSFLGTLQAEGLGDEEESIE
jgi:hypothetical protein